MQYVADTFAGDIQYGKRTSLCSIFMSVSTIDVKSLLPVMKQYADNNGIDIATYFRDYIKDTKIDFEKNIRQWNWQVCSEFGWF